MNWTEKDVQTDRVEVADTARSKLLDMVRKEALPTIQREASNGAPEFNPLEFQPVRSPGIYDGEFGSKGDDLIFHFWPYGYNQAASAKQRTPNFKPGFQKMLKFVMGETFGDKRVEIQEDKDVGALFVKALNWGQHQFRRELAIKACEALHGRMGGTNS